VSGSKTSALSVFGAGSAGCGMADQLRNAMVADGTTQEEANTQVWLVDKQGQATPAAVRSMALVTFDSVRASPHRGRVRP
jgi:malic enzyme